MLQNQRILLRRSRSERLIPFSRVLFPGVLGFVIVCAARFGLMAAEPTYEQAVARWPDMRRPVIFLGLKDHPDEFAFMWNGNLSLDTGTLVDADRALFKDRADKSLQVTFSLGNRPEFQSRYIETESTRPSLKAGYLPVALVEHRFKGAIVLQEAFAADISGRGVAEWDDAVFLHIRFSVLRPQEDGTAIRIWAQLAKDHTQYAMRSRSNVRISRKAPPYPSPLKYSGNAVVTGEGGVILAASKPFKFYRQLPEDLNSVALRESQLDRNLCEFSLGGTKGSFVDLVIPFLPVTEATLGQVRSKDYDQLRDSIVGFWEGELSRGMQIEVPEKELNDLWKYHLPISFITADTYPNGDHVADLSPHHYESYWPTPNAMQFQALAQQGHFEETKAYLKPFRDPDRQRPVPNTGSSFATTEGYISGPTEYVYISWVSDHGAILWAASEYYLLSRDEDFLQAWLPVMLKGLEWVARERAQTKRHGGLGAGLMPIGRGTDDSAQSLFVWSDAWVYRGLEGVCRVLRAIGHSEAKHWEEEAEDYRRVYQERFRDVLSKTARWTHPDGRKIPFVPYDLRQSGPYQGKIDLFYIDTGPLFLGVSGLFDASDEVMDWTLSWFTDGPYSGSYDPQASEWWDPGSLPFEMSSGEPCYSWNIPLRFARNEREKFLEGFYTLCAGSVSRRLLGGVEHRDGIQGVPVGNSVINNHLRNMLVYENQMEGGLELLRNSPSRWIVPGCRISVQQAQSYFGSINYSSQAEDQEIQFVIDAPERQPVKWIKIHLVHPEGRPVKKLEVKGNASGRVVSDTLVELAGPRGSLKARVVF